MKLRLDRWLEGAALGWVQGMAVGGVSGGVYVFAAWGITSGFAWVLGVVTGVGLYAWLVDKKRWDWRVKRQPPVVTNGETMRCPDCDAAWTIASRTTVTLKRVDRDHAHAPE